MENTEETTPAPPQKKALRRLLKAIFIFLGIWVAAIFLMHIALSSNVLTGIINRYAAEYVDGEVNFGNVQVNMFQRFPNIRLSMDDVSITYPSDRFESMEQAGAQGELLYQGTGEAVDTLMSFERFSASLNVASLLAGKISIPHMRLTKPRIFAHSYDSDNTNWDLFRFATTEEEEDTTGLALLPKITLGRISLEGKPHIVYTDSRDTVFAMIDVGSASFNGKLETRNTGRNKIGLSLESIFIAGRVASDTLAFRLEELHIHEHEDHADIDASANATLLTRSYGRLTIPMSLNGTVDLPKDSIPVIEVGGMQASIADIPININARLGFGEEKTYIEAMAEISQWNLDHVMTEYVGRFIPEVEKIKTDATVSLLAACFGHYDHRTGKLPSFSASISLPESYLKHADIDADLTVALEANVANDERDRIMIDIPKMDVMTKGLVLTAEGRTDNLLEEDMLLNVKAGLSADLDSLASLIPESIGIEASGSITAKVDGSTRLSQLDIYNFSYSDLLAEIISDRLILKSEADSLNVDIDGLSFSVGPENMTSRTDTTKTFRMLALTASLTGTDISYKESMTLKGRNVNLSAKNSAESMSHKDSLKLGRLGGSLTADNILFRDAVSTSIELDHTVNRFQMIPNKENPQVPVLNLTSQNKDITFSTETDKAVLTDAEIKAEATMTSIERRKRREARLDSLAAVYPDTPRDSLMSRARAERGSASSWTSEDDFRDQDIDLRLDEAITRYFREWDMKGSIGIRTGEVVTPHFPLHNILEGFHASFNNNEIVIDDIMLKAGNSEISGRGSVKGLRRALTGRRNSSSVLDIDVALNSSRIDADELLNAYTAGMSFNPDPMSAGPGEVSNEESPDLVISDTAAAAVSSPLIVIPSNINASLTLDAEKITFSDLAIDKLTTRIMAKERCLQITDTRAATNLGQIDFEGFYATRSKSDIKAGFDFNFKDITADKVIDLMPSVDTLIPMLKSFKGLLDCELAATAQLDTTMNILTPSINGVLRIGGRHLTIDGSDETFRSVAKMLKFKNLDEGRIDAMTVEGVIKDNTLEVFPFVMQVDRYTMAMSGVQNLDLSFRYHVSMIKSPMLFRFGVDLYGNDFNNMKFRLGKAKYKSADVPVFSAEIDRTRVSLSESIRNIFAKGVDNAIAEHQRQNAIEEHKKAIGYVEAIDMEMEQLSEIQETIIKGE